jgi:hypothetical protein
MSHWLIQLILHLLNTLDNDTRGFCVWAWMRQLGFYLACS